MYTNVNINPGAEEVLDNPINENCDGYIDVSIPSETKPEPESMSEQALLNAFLIYPNPASQVLYVVKPDKHHFYIEIFDTRQRLVERWENRTALDISHLSNGIYFLIYHDLTVGKRIVKKLIIR